MIDAPPEPNPRRERIWRVVFLSDTPAGRAFDIALLVLIVVSVSVVVLESVPALRAAHGPLFHAVEWVLTGAFTVEYLLRLAVCRRPLRYATSFFGVVDLVAIAPSYLELLFPGGQYLLIVRVLRLLRMFRVLKLAQHVSEGSVLLGALVASRRKIAVFLVGVLSIVLVEGTAMYLLEGSTNPGFGSIPNSVYWAIVTITTVGYGDVTPETFLGKIMASVIMLTGFAIIAVPTGIVTSELTRQADAGRLDDRTCAECGTRGHPRLARHCHQCGVQLPL